MEIAVYTRFSGDEDRVFNLLNELKETHPSFSLHIVGSDQDNEPFITWAEVNNVSYIPKKIFWDQYGYRALPRAIKELVTEHPINLFILMYIDSYSLEITHLILDKNIAIRTV